MIEQGSDAWHDARRGKVTASRVADVIAKTKSGYAASRANYLAELLCERLTGDTAPSFMNDAMRWGTEKEPEARAAYAFRTDAEVEQIAFVDHPRISMAGASPDGLIGTDGLLEIKCPQTSTHLETLASGKPAAKYVTQMQWQLACTGRDWCDFVSYDPRLPENLRFFLTRIPRDDAFIEATEAEVVAFLAELDGRIADLTTRYGAQLKEAA
ncbi:MAG: lambda exonuclease family protein [Brevundimonas sp.]|uniref:lambda exonuclease family protein n=1 Tax=Brevundimonas sp. TaxID=1871086 RepID=UPI00391ABB19